MYKTTNIVLANYTHTSNNPFKEKHKTTTMTHIHKIQRGTWDLLTMAESLASNCQGGRYDVNDIVPTSNVYDMKVM